MSFMQSVSVLLWSPQKPGNVGVSAPGRFLNIENLFGGSTMGPYIYSQLIQNGGVLVCLWMGLSG